MGSLNRRAVLGALASAPLLGAAARPQARTTTPRVRAGAPVHVHCPGADAFRVEGDLDAPRTFAAPTGALRVRAPMTVARDGAWAQLRWIPLTAGRPCGAPVTVQVLALPEHFGA